MRIRMASFFGLAVAVMFIIWGAAPVAAQQPAGQVVKLGEGETLTITGFISASYFANHGRFGAFGQGQNAELADSAQATTDKVFTDGDVRNTRINFTFAAGPVLGKWFPRATLESDFFGAFNGNPPFGDEQPQMRIRFAYVDLTNGRTTLRIGQFWSPMFGEVPVSLTHLAFPLGYGATGMVGWRYPGIFLYHDLTPGKPLTAQLQLAAFKGSGPLGPGRDTPLVIGTGEASGVPEFEARLNLGRRTPKLNWSGYIVGHVDWKDTSGTGVAGKNLSAWGFEAGLNIAPSKFTLHGNFYYGKAIGQQFAHITQQGNIRGWGAWAQAGYDFTPRWSLWAYYGMDQPDAARFTSETGGPSRSRPTGSSAVTRYAATGPNSADQVALSVLY